jgi:hypothetical protein
MKPLRTITLCISIALLASCSFTQQKETDQEAFDRLYKGHVTAWIEWIESIEGDTKHIIDFDKVKSMIAASGFVDARMAGDQKYNFETSINVLRDATNETFPLLNILFDGKVSSDGETPEPVNIEFSSELIANEDGVFTQVRDLLIDITGFDEELPFELAQWYFVSYDTLNDGAEDSEIDVAEIFRLDNTSNQKINEGLKRIANEYNFWIMKERLSAEEGMSTFAVDLDTEAFSKAWREVIALLEETGTQVDDELETEIDEIISKINSTGEISFLNDNPKYYKYDFNIVSDDEVFDSIEGEIVFLPDEKKFRFVMVGQENEPEQDDNAEAEEPGRVEIVFEEQKTESETKYIGRINVDNETETVDYEFLEVKVKEDSFTAEIREPENNEVAAKLDFEKEDDFWKGTIESPMLPSAIIDVTKLQFDKGDIIFNHEIRFALATVFQLDFSLTTEEDDSISIEIPQDSKPLEEVFPELNQTEPTIEVAEEEEDETDTGDVLEDEEPVEMTDETERVDETTD